MVICRYMLDQFACSKTLYNLEGRIQISFVYYIMIYIMLAHISLIYYLKVGFTTLPLSSLNLDQYILLVVLLTMESKLCVSSILSHLWFNCMLQLCKQDQLLLHPGLLMQNLGRQRSLCQCKFIIIYIFSLYVCCMVLIPSVKQMSYILYQKKICLPLLQFSITT